MSSLTKLAAPEPLTVPATDGTQLSYYKIGATGPSIIVLPGAMSSALTQLELATALSGAYTVFLLSRRSRGLSGPYPASLTSLKDPLLPNRPKSHTASQTIPNPDTYPIYDPAFSAQVLETDLDDLATLMRHTESRILLGISGGALLILAALLPDCVVRMPPITQAIIFEPPLLFPSSLAQNNNTMDLEGIRRYEQEMAGGDVAAALVTAMKVVQLGPGWLNYVPRWILRSFTKMIMGVEVKEQAKKRAAGGLEEGAVTMEALAPVLRYDSALCEAMIQEPERFRETGIIDGRRILLLGGELSMGYIKEALGTLEGAMCSNDGSVRRIEIKGAGHELLENKIRNGKVKMGVGTIKDFLDKGVAALT